MHLTMMIGEKFHKLDSVRMTKNIFFSQGEKYNY